MDEKRLIESTKEQEKKNAQREREENKDSSSEKNKKEGNSGADDNVIFVGSKPFMNYVTSVVIQLTTKNKDEVVIKARGKFISRAVDIAEVVLRRFMEEQNLKVKDIRIGSEEFKNKEGKEVIVSTIEIVLRKE